jgi:hypothetical protein
MLASGVVAGDEAPVGSIFDCPETDQEAEHDARAKSASGTRNDHQKKR